MNLTPGARLGPYEIISLLGAGGMGEVYRARDSRLKREVAVKVLPQAFSLDADRLRRFEQEALATAALNHPNILAVFDIGTHESSPYVVSELLEGETLRERLRGGSIAVRKTLDYALQIAHGLAAAHEKGIIHRDLKPENLFVTKDGRLKILDFGLAKLTQPEGGMHTSLPTMTHASEAGVVMGTAGYMSPEQVRGVAVDARSDIFSFGAILYEMLSGKRAFHGDTAAEARFHSASDIAFDLEHLSGVSGSSARVMPIPAAQPRRRLLSVLAAGLGIAVIMLGLGWWLGRRSGVGEPRAEYQQITFRTGSIGNARFTPDGSVVYRASWDGGDNQLYMSRMDDPGARELGLKDAELLAISKSGELAIRLNSVRYGGYARSGTLARVPLSGGTPREVLENVQDADWSANGESLSVVRYVPENGHWRLEYPIGKVLFDSINWISDPKISPDGKWIAFSDHENPGGDDEGSVAVMGADGIEKEKKLSSGWESIQGILWSSKSDEIWFTASNSGSALNPMAVSLSGKLRPITNVPGGVWLQDVRNGAALVITHQQRIGIRGMAPAGKEEHELGWFGWSIVRDISRDGHKIIFEEEGNGGGPNYTVFLRDTDGSPPARIGEGNAEAISPDNKWVITKPAKGGALNLVPTGAGETKPLTHDAVSYGQVRFLPDGKRLLASGIEAGRGRRDYLIDISTGDSKPITPEGVAGVRLSPDGRSTTVLGPDGKWGIWPLDGGGIRLIPGLESKYYVVGWSQDGGSVYVASTRSDKIARVYRVNTQTGKMDPWKTFGAEAGAGITETGAPGFSSDGTAYAYVYVRVLSEAYVVTGLR
jgi:eukaryotic-like serine/threonine-protein kinase